MPAIARLAPLVFALALAAPAHAAPRSAGVPADTLYARKQWAPAARAYEKLVRTEPANPRA